jgi:hypothetical protein
MNVKHIRVDTKTKIADLLDRRSRIAARTDKSPAHREEVVRSYDRMIRQYRREIKLYEATHAKDITTTVSTGQANGNSTSCRSDASVWRRHSQATRR